MVHHPSHHIAQVRIGVGTGVVELVDGQQSEKNPPSVRFVFWNERPMLFSGTATTTRRKP